VAKEEIRGMKVVLNGDPVEFPESELSVGEVMRRRKFVFQMIIVILNGKQVLKADHETTKVHDGDDMQAIHMVAGG
jgi:sulfur carrier protein